MAFNIVRYSQQDPQWKNNIIGGGPDNIGYVGCALSCVAMYSSGWGYTETPGSLNQKLIANSGYSDENIRWGVVSLIHPQIKFITLNVGASAPIAQINASLSAGQPVIVEVDFSADDGLQTHWVLLYAQQGNDYLILDPWPYPPDKQDVTLMTRFSHGKPLQQTIKAVAFYQSTTGSSVPAPTPGDSTPTNPPPTTTPSTPSTPSTPTTPLPVPVATDLIIQVIATATAGIKLHNQATPDSLANYAEMPGVPLMVIEAKTGALAKIGQNGQWIYVQDPQGHQGFVAGWFVEKSAATSPTNTPVPAPAPAPSGPSTPSTPIPAPGTTPPASGPQRLIVVVLNSVGAGGLRVRQQPSPGGAVVNIEKAGARLTVIEPGDTAIPKIGVAGQWVAVKATNNQRGYVMAQFIQLKQ